MSLMLRREESRSSKVLSHAEDKFLAEKEKQIEADLSRREIQQGVTFEPKDPQILEKRLAEVKKLRQNANMQRLEGSERVRAESELKKIEDIFAKKWGGRIPTHSEYWMRPKEGGIQYLNLVDRISRLNKDREYQELIKRWKFLRRGLEPDDKHIDNTMNLFSH